MPDIDIDIDPAIAAVCKRLNILIPQAYAGIVTLLTDIQGGKGAPPNYLTTDELNTYYDIISSISVRLMIQTQTKYGSGSASGAAAPMSTLGNKYNFSSSSGGGGLIGSWSDFILNRSLQDILPTIMLNDRTKGTLIGGLRRRVTDAPNNHIHKS